MEQGQKWETEKATLQKRVDELMNQCSIMERDHQKKLKEAEEVHRCWEEQLATELQVLQTQLAQEQTTMRKHRKIFEMAYNKMFDYTPLQGE